MEILSRREELQSVKIGDTTHAGLWLDKYLEKQVEGGGENAKAPHLKAVVDDKPVSPAYVAFFTRWQQSLERAGTLTRKAQAQGRLIIGLGSESVLETSITLHRTYGVPYIPGSALKGLAARYARTRLEDQTWGQGSEAYKILFGDTGKAGYVTFFDALYIPGSAKRDRPLALDVITVHHPEYYSGKDSPPADWDNPNPVPFLSTTGSYLVALHGPDSWVEAAFEILTLALAEEGIGAKTSSGYGRMVLGNVAEKPLVEEPDASWRKQPHRPQDLQPGQVLEGQIRSIAGFGAFVDIGVGQDGLIHISELAEGFVECIEDVVQVGQTVRVKVLDVERRKSKWRIGLTIKNVEQ
jgi:CRISPR-associated protein Cmr6